MKKALTYPKLTSFFVVTLYLLAICKFCTIRLGYDETAMQILANGDLSGTPDARAAAARRILDSSALSHNAPA